MRFLVAGCDNRIAHYDASGVPLSTYQSDQAVRDMAVVFMGHAPVWIMASDNGLRAYDTDWHALGVVPGRYARVTKTETTSPRVLAITDQGLLECLNTGGRESDHPL